MQIQGMNHFTIIAEDLEADTALLHRHPRVHRRRSPAAAVSRHLVLHRQGAGAARDRRAQAAGRARRARPHGLHHHRPAGYGKEVAATRDFRTTSGSRSVRHMQLFFLDLRNSERSHSYSAGMTAVSAAVLAATPVPMAQTLLQVEHPQPPWWAFPVVYGVSFAIPPGPVPSASLVSPGSGKSLTARSLLPACSHRLCRGSNPAAGSCWTGRDPTTLDERVMATSAGGRIGHHLPGAVREPEPGAARGRPDRRNHPRTPPARRRDARAPRPVRRVGIPEPERRLDHYPYQISRRPKPARVSGSRSPPSRSCSSPTSPRPRSTSQSRRRSSTRSATAAAPSGWPCSSSRTTSPSPPMAHRLACSMPGRIVQFWAGPCRSCNQPQHPYTQALLRLHPAPRHAARAQAGRDRPGSAPPPSEWAAPAGSRRVAGTLCGLPRARAGHSCRPATAPPRAGSMRSRPKQCRPHDPPLARDRRASVHHPLPRILARCTCTPWTASTSACRARRGPGIVGEFGCGKSTSAVPSSAWPPDQRATSVSMANR